MNSGANSAPQRDQRPCDNCRRRKTRCLFSSLEAVTCLLCVSLSISCTYVQEAPRKKRPASALVDAETDSTLQNVHEKLKRVPNAKTVANASKSKVKPAAKKTSPPNPRIRAARNLNPSIAAPSICAPTMGTASANTFAIDQSLSHQTRRSTSVVGATPDYDISLTRNMSFSPTTHESTALQRPNEIDLLRRASSTVHFTIRNDTPAELAADLTALTAIESAVSPHGPELVNIYFRIMHPSFPILHKTTFLEKYNTQTYRALTPTSLGAVYLIALTWWSYSPVLSSQPKPDADHLADLVMTAFFNGHRRPKLADLQGGMILMQYPPISSCTLSGHLLAMAQSLGIHVDPGDWHIPSWERGARKRVAWALFMQDKWASLIFGRPTLMRLELWEVGRLELSDFPETAKDDDMSEGSAEVEKGKLIFLNMVSLTEIVAEILDKLYPRKIVLQPIPIWDMLERAKPLQLMLNSWHANLPATLSLDNTTPRKLSSVGYLHLAYYTTEITLHRAILRGKCPPSDAQSESLYRIAHSAAVTRFSAALAFLRTLKVEHLQSFWYFPSGTCLSIIGVFAGLLCATCPADDQATWDSILANLAEYRWLLRLNSTSAEFMKHAVGMLDIWSPHFEKQVEPGAVSNASKDKERTETQITDPPLGAVLGNLPFDSGSRQSSVSENIISGEVVETPSENQVISPAITDVVSGVAETEDNGWIFSGPIDGFTHDFYDANLHGLGELENTFGQEQFSRLGFNQISQ